ncbi:MAG: hypothetical protein JO307_27900 [Bryobacterales bacterium]|nr:hypothetical protein [Bryobacterales bacterium]MBV9401180.1 hypothetical protein [Bryobacterales bacterium]
MALAMERFVHSAPQRPRQSATEAPESKLNISVVFTSVDSTLAALKAAGTLAQRLDARITLLVPQVVPYHLPLESPPVLLDWNERRLHVMANNSAVETKVNLYLCRDGLATLNSVLKPHSLVVIGGESKWWPTPEKKLARQLRKAGHEVIFTETR